MLDGAELTSLRAFFEHATVRIRHVRRALSDVAADVEPARATLTDPALATLIAQTFGYLDGPAALPKAEERMDWHAQLAARVRTLAAAADGADATWSSAEIARFTRTHRKAPDLASRVILDAIHAGRIRHSRSVAHHCLLPVHLNGLSNGHLPSSRLTPVGDHERLLTPVARQYLRMAAAGTGNLAAAPGHSTHGLGISVDINTTSPAVVPSLRTPPPTASSTTSVGTVALDLPTSSRLPSTTGISCADGGVAPHADSLV